ncbi:MAG TPA: sulfurtransferase [Patescibacteria group bacterium]|nr:sulfurtransferase [Patescibacteria group bacterium]
MSRAHPRPELLASPDWLAENFGRSDLRILDVRWRPDGTSRRVFNGGHVPGATHLDWRAALTDQAVPNGMVLLAPPDQVAAALAGAGIGNGSTVVVYDDTASLYAARTWWSLRACGLDSVRVLDGGFGAWLATGRPVSHAVPEPSRGTFTPRAQLRLRLTASDARALVGSRDAIFLDARTPAEYRGFAGAGRRLGHIPGAVNLPVAETTEPGTGRFRDRDELSELLAAAGVSRARRTVCYDGTGVGAAKLAFVLALMGHDDVAVYDGGWAEWGDRLDLPIER